MDRKERCRLLVLMILLVVTRLYHLNTPPLEIEESWRQADTESMAWNFAHYDSNILHPNLNYDGPLPNIPALEIQITTYLIGVLYKLFGHQYFLARLVPLVFFISSGLFLYLFARRYMKPEASAFSLLVYGLLPINVYYSRAIMPESAALMFWNGGFYFFDQWVSAKSQGADKTRTLIWSFVFTVLTIMTKPPVVFVAIPMLFLCFHYLGRGWIRIKGLWAFALGCIIIPGYYYYFSAQIAEFKFTVGITQDIILKKAFTAFYSPEAYQFFSVNIPRTLGLIGILTVFAGLVALTKQQRVILIWFGAMFVEVVLCVSAIRAGYYLIFFTVPCSLIIGNFLYRIMNEPTGKIMALVFVLAMAGESFNQVKPMFRLNTMMQTQAQVVERLTREDELLVVGAVEPCLLSLTDRRGWRYQINLYPETPADPWEELAGYIAKGAKYFVPIQGKIYGDEDGQIIKGIEKRFTKIEPVAGYPIYQLK